MAHILARNYAYRSLTRDEMALSHLLHERFRVIFYYNPALLPDGLAPMARARADVIASVFPDLFVGLIDVTLPEFQNTHPPFAALVVTLKRKT